MEPKEHVGQEPDWERLWLNAGRTFRPNVPVDIKDVFAGRREQIRRVLDVIVQAGQHAIIFGERGVGKTSLANVISQYITASEDELPLISSRINCENDDSFASTWRKVFNEIELTQTTELMGFDRSVRQVQVNANQLLGDAEPTPDVVRRVLTIMGTRTTPILVVDEFDRLPQSSRRAFADLIKTLSDHATPATVVLVGVADSVERLLEEHQSLSRSLVEIQMPRMAGVEIREIVKQGSVKLGMQIAPDALARVTDLAQGLPHYAHLLGLHAARAAIDRKSFHVAMPDVDEAIRRAMNDSQHSTRNSYLQAVYSARTGSLFADVLLACAQAQADELGFFAAQDVRAPLRRITGRSYGIPTFAKHLNEFLSAKRGKVLQRKGEKRLYRFRFSDPLLQPFVIMQGIVSGKPTGSTDGD